MTDRGVTLTTDQVAPLAQRLIARHLADVADRVWMDWEMVPELSEDSYRRLATQVNVVAVLADWHADLLDGRAGVDSRALLKELS
jgi:hypothetical protein